MVFFAEQISTNPDNEILLIRLPNTKAEIKKENFMIKTISKSPKMQKRQKMKLKILYRSQNQDIIYDFVKNENLITQESH
jgi:hypothetical protein